MAGQEGPLVPAATTVQCHASWFDPTATTFRTKEPSAAMVKWCVKMMRSGDMQYKVDRVVVLSMHWPLLLLRAREAMREEHLKGLRARQRLQAAARRRLRLRPAGRGGGRG